MQIRTRVFEIFARKAGCVSKKKLVVSKVNRAFPAQTLPCDWKLRKKNRRNNASSAPAPIFNAASGANEIDTGLVMQP